MAYDLLIKNGRVVDGSGAPSFYADVAVSAGQIVGVGKFNESATRTIDAHGRVVAPVLSTITPTMIPRRCGTLFAAPRLRMATPR